MQFLPRLMFDRIWITLQPANVPLQLLVLLLQTPQLQLEALSILPLLLVRRQPVLSEDHVVTHRQRQYSSGSGRNFAPAHLGPLIPTHKDRGRPYLIC
ncbi:MAG: hypothetical protein JWQ49_6279 [Edaphobacter sp.]|nr:hypothetical protein [Edaphobacter sp.]